VSLETDLAALERRVLGSGRVKTWLDRADNLRKALAANNASAVASSVLSTIPPQVEAQALAAMAQAFTAGFDDALGLVDNTPALRALAQSGKPSAAARKIVEGIDKAGREAVAKAQSLARAGADSQAVAAPILGHANSVRGRVTEGVNRAGNEGVTTVADEAGLSTVWVAETNACVRCLKYSGQVARVGEDFPGGLTYGRPVGGPSLPHPPLHPRCRCVVEPLRSQEYADALRREADRSVLRGFSLESESMGTRIDAADRLLATNPNAPKSVLQYSRNAVKRGEFPTRGRPNDEPTTPGKGPGFPPNAPPPR